jgi:hypothetical protein
MVQYLAHGVATDKREAGADGHRGRASASDADRAFIRVSNMK